MDPITLVKTIRTIFSLPDVVVKINEAVGSDDCSNAELATIVLNDPVLTAKVLKFANSSYFSFARKVDTVSQAICIIGRKELRNLAIASTVTTTFDGIPPSLIDMDEFWYYSVSCGTTARLLSVYSDSEEQEKFFVIGLLHAVGRLIFISEFPEEYAAILQLNKRDNDQLVNAESETFGFSYADLGAELLNQWDFPPSIWEPVKNHLNPLKIADVAYKNDACLLHIAANFASFIQSYANKKLVLDEIRHSYRPEVWSHLGLAPDLDKVIIEESGPLIFDMMSLIRPQAIMVC